MLAPFTPGFRTLFARIHYPGNVPVTGRTKAELEAKVRFKES